jgi:glycosyltransferase involved in cell wall biosynthesis
MYKFERVITNPLISVLMTAYNREKYIGDAIQSVLNSSYENFELIIVDDFSKDNTVSIAKGYAAKDNRIMIYCNEINIGQFANRNKAASYAKGEFLKYVDSDDIIYPNTLKIMLDCMQRFPDAALGFCLTHGPCKNPLPYRIPPTLAFQQHFFEGGLLFVGPSGLIVKKDAFELVNGFEEFGMPSDNHFTLKIASKYPVVCNAQGLILVEIT